jgi:hypothetical protein
MDLTHVWMTPIKPVNGDDGAGESNTHLIRPIRLTLPDGSLLNSLKFTAASPSQFSSGTHTQGVAHSRYSLPSLAHLVA